MGSEAIQVQAGKRTGDTFAGVEIRVFKRQGNSYCFMTVVPDLSTSEKNIKEIEEIVESFTYKE